MAILMRYHSQILFKSPPNFERPGKQSATSLQSSPSRALNHTVRECPIQGRWRAAAVYRLGTSYLLQTRTPLGATLSTSTSLREKSCRGRVRQEKIEQLPMHSALNLWMGRQSTNYDEGRRHACGRGCRNPSARQ